MVRRPDPSSLARFLERRGSVFRMAISIVGVAALGLADYWTGPEIAWALFYLLPIALVSWFDGKWAGWAVSLASAVTWWAADLLSGRIYSHPLIGVWNAATRLGFFVVVTWLFSALRRALEVQRALARHDFVTGALNGRAFDDVLRAEIARCHRHETPLSLAYLDLDDFKEVNDLLGHQAGDDVLRVVADTMKQGLRVNDAVARLGGDEFGVLLPETDAAGAREVVARLKAHLDARVRAGDRSVTVSIGLLTCESCPGSSDEVIRAADRLMYEVKREGKNSIRQGTCAEAGVFGLGTEGTAGISIDDRA